MFIATASREPKRSIKIWQNTDAKFDCVSNLPEKKLPDATAVCFFPEQTAGKYTLIVGQEYGELTVWRWEAQQEWQLLHKLHTNL